MLMDKETQIKSLRENVELLKVRLNSYKILVDAGAQIKKLS